MTQQKETFIHITPRTAVGVGCPGKCDWSGWIEFTEPTTGRVTGGTQACKTCGMFAISQSLRDGD
jgi:hypothetical protein